MRVCRHILNRHKKFFISISSSVTLTHRLWSPVKCWRSSLRTFRTSDHHVNVLLSLYTVGSTLLLLGHEKVSEIINCC